MTTGNLFTATFKLSVPGGTVTNGVGGIIHRDKVIPTELLRDIRYLRETTLAQLSRIGEPLHSSVYLMDKANKSRAESLLAEAGIKYEFYRVTAIKEYGRLFPNESLGRFANSIELVSDIADTIPSDTHLQIIISNNAHKAFDCLMSLRSGGTLIGSRSTLLEIASSLSRWALVFPQLMSVRSALSLSLCALSSTEEDAQKFISPVLRNIVLLHPDNCWMISDIDRTPVNVDSDAISKRYFEICESTDERQSMFLFDEEDDSA